MRFRIDVVHDHINIGIHDNRTTPSTTRTTSLNPLAFELAKSLKKQGDALFRALQLQYGRQFIRSAPVHLAVWKRWYWIVSRGAPSWRQGRPS